MNNILFALSQNVWILIYILAIVLSPLILFGGIIILTSIIGGIMFGIAALIGWWQDRQEKHNDS